jgi:hypothetical protein
LQQLPASGFETEWRNDILRDKDCETGVAQTPIAIEPSVSRRRLDLLATIYLRWRLDGIVVRHFSPSGLDLYPAAKKFEAGVFYEFANIEGFQQISRVRQYLDLVTRTTYVLFPWPKVCLVPLEILKHQVNREPLNFKRRQRGGKFNLSYGS